MSEPTGKLKFAYNTIRKLEARIKELESNSGWVSVSEDLPKKDGYYFVITKDLLLPKVFKFEKFTLDNFKGNNGFNFPDVLAWMEIPASELLWFTFLEPPKDKEQS